MTNTTSDIRPPDHHRTDVERGFFEPNQFYLDQVMRTSSTKDELLPFVVGSLSILLAFLVSALDAAYGVNAARSSISHYFYAPIAGSAFAIILSFIAAFMFAYRGQSAVDGWLTTLGSIGALLTAIFPTAGLGIKGGQTIDHRFVEDAALRSDQNGKLIGEALVGGGNAIQRWLQDFFGLFMEEIEVQTLKMVEVNGEMIEATVRTTYLVGNTLSQGIHQTGAITVIASLIALSIVHWQRTTWVVYNIDADLYIKRDVQRSERIWTWIWIIVMLIGAWMASQLVFVSAAHTVSGWLSNIQVAALLLGDDFSSIQRPVFHGELLALVAFGAAWLLQWKRYRAFKKNDAQKQIDEIIARRNSSAA